jgi:hypothetical protein
MYRTRKGSVQQEERTMFYQVNANKILNKDHMPIATPAEKKFFLKN